MLKQIAIGFGASSVLLGCTHISSFVSSSTSSSRLAALDCRLLGFPDWTSEEEVVFDKRDGKLYEYDEFYKAYVRVVDTDGMRQEGSLYGPVLNVRSSGYKEPQSGGWMHAQLREFNLETMRGRIKSSPENAELPPASIAPGEEEFQLECRYAKLRSTEIRE
jgi:hypothetical protein